MASESKGDEADFLAHYMRSLDNEFTRQQMEVQAVATKTRSRVSEVASVEETGLFSEKDGRLLGSEYTIEGQVFKVTARGRTRNPSTYAETALSAETSDEIYKLRRASAGSRDYSTGGYSSVKPAREMASGAWFAFVRSHDNKVFGTSHYNDQLQILIKEATFERMLGRNVWVFTREQPHYRDRKTGKPTHRFYKMTEWLGDSDLFDFMTKQAHTFQEKFHIAELLILDWLKMARLGMVHNDIKPENIVLGLDAGGVTSVRLCDFGTAARKGKNRDRVEGTPGYVAAENFKVGEPHNFCPDLWAMRCILAELFVSSLFNIKTGKTGRRHAVRSSRCIPESSWRRRTTLKVSEERKLEKIFLMLQGFAWKDHSQTREERDSGIRERKADMTFLALHEVFGREGRIERVQLKRAYYLMLDKYGGADKNTLALSMRDEDDLGKVIGKLATFSLDVDDLYAKRKQRECDAEIKDAQDNLARAWGPNKGPIMAAKEKEQSVRHELSGAEGTSIPEDITKAAKAALAQVENVTQAALLLQRGLPEDLTVLSQRMEAYVSTIAAYVVQAHSVQDVAGSSSGAAPDYADRIERLVGLAKPCLVMIDKKAGEISSVCRTFNDTVVGFDSAGLERVLAALDTAMGPWREYKKADIQWPLVSIIDAAYQKLSEPKRGEFNDEKNRLVGFLSVRDDVAYSPDLSRNLIWRLVRLIQCASKKRGMFEPNSWGSLSECLNKIDDRSGVNVDFMAVVNDFKGLTAAQARERFRLNYSGRVVPITHARVSGTAPR
jgi:serine/threonine protein kinase